MPTMASCQYCFSMIMNTEAITMTNQKITKAQELTFSIALRNTLRNSLYEDLKEGLISQADYNELFEGYKHKISELLMVIGEYEREIQDILQDRNEKYKWIDHFAGYQNIQNLTRIAAVELIDQIKVYEKDRIEVTFNFDDCYTQILDQLTQLGYEVDSDEDGRIHFEKMEVPSEEKV